ERHAPGKFTELEGIAQRIAQADDEHQPHSTEQLQGGQDGWVTTKPSLPPNEMDGIEARQINRDPCREAQEKLARSSHGKYGLKLGKRQKRNADVTLAGLELLAGQLALELIAEGMPSRFALDLL